MLSRTGEGRPGRGEIVRTIELPNLNHAFKSKPNRVLLVASTGGHLEQLTRIAKNSRVFEDARWVTFDSAQSRSLLPSKNVTIIPNISPRDWRSMLSSFPAFLRLMRSRKFDAVVSTGAGIAVPAFVAAAVFRIPSLYIESISRTQGPSLTGQILSRTRLARSTWTQHRTWEGGRWKYHGAVLGEYRAAIRREHKTVRRVFVTLGTLKDHRFDALLDQILVLQSDAIEFIWQTGCTDGRELPGRQFSYITSEEFDRYATSADVVISHAGVGSVLRLLELGVFPLLVPRRAERGEQVDNHQEQISALMHNLELARVVEAPNLKIDDLVFTAGRRVERDG